MNITKITSIINSEFFTEYKQLTDKPLIETQSEVNLNAYISPFPAKDFNEYHSLVQQDVLSKTAKQMAKFVFDKQPVSVFHIDSPIEISISDKMISFVLHFCEQ